MSNHARKSGFFIVLEGGEGSGKSTQAPLLGHWLESVGRAACVTRQPGGTEVGTALRSIVLDPATGDLSARAEALIYLADKAEHVHQVIQPALARGEVVVCDRYVDSTLAYQGEGRGLSVDQFESVANWAVEGLRPDLTLVLDIDPRVGLARAGELDRIESEPVDFHDRVRQSFLDLAAAGHSSHVVVNADQDIDALQDELRSIVAERLGLAP